MTNVRFENGAFHFFVEETDPASRRKGPHPTKFSPHEQMFKDLFVQMILAAASAGFEAQWFEDSMRLLSLAQASARDRQSQSADQQQPVQLAELN